MKCLFCGCDNSKVVDSRALKDGSIRRRRECENCHKRFSSYEMIESNPLVVNNIYNVREPFMFEKLYESLVYSNYCRDNSEDELDRLAKKIERKLLSLGKQEINTKEIVHITSETLSEVDEVSAFIYHIQHNDIKNLFDVKKFF